MNHKKTAIILLLTLITTAYALSDDPLFNAKRITACLLKLMQDISPYMMFALLLIGGVTYITAAEDSKQRILGKKFLSFAIIGVICVYSLLLIAAQPPFSIAPNMCVELPPGSTLPPPIPPRYLIEPDPDSTIT